MPAPKQPSVIEEDPAGPTGRLALEVDDVGTETYICGNPLSGQRQSNSFSEAGYETIFART